MTTEWIGRRGFLSVAQLRELDARGQVIGTHSASHPTRFSACSWAQMVREWEESRKTLEDILGHAVTVGSVPGGWFSAEVASAAGEAGLDALFTSEPTTEVGRVGACVTVGRFTIRRGHSSAVAPALLSSAPWARWRAWMAWNAKGLARPILGPVYPRLAGWMAVRR